MRIKRLQLFSSSILVMVYKYLYRTFSILVCLLLAHGGSMNYFNNQVGACLLIKIQCSNKNILITTRITQPLFLVPLLKLRSPSKKLHFLLPFGACLYCILSLCEIIIHAVFVPFSRGSCQVFNVFHFLSMLACKCRPYFCLLQVIRRNIRQRRE